MPTQKKKKSKSQSKAQSKGHYCKVCGEYKANEKFSGKGHAAHICKSCASKSPEQKSEDMTINKLYGMASRYISETEKNWLKNRRNDGRPEVRELAQQIFNEKFPRLARNEIKKQLHICNIVLHIHGEIYDEYGDEYNMNVIFKAETSGKIIRKSYSEDNILMDEQSIEIGQSAMKKLFNITVSNYEIPFLTEGLCFESSDDEQDGVVLSDNDEIDNQKTTWSVEIKFKNDTEKALKGYEFIPDSVLSLFLDFQNYFEYELSDNECSDINDADK